MKILYLVFCFLSFSIINSFGQVSLNNFQIDKSDIYWQYVFETNLTLDELVEELKEAGLIDKMEVIDHKISGNLKSIDADYKGAGFSEMGTPIYISRSNISGYLTIEYKEFRYRCTLRRIELTQKYTDPLSEQGEITKLEFYALKNGKNEMTNGFKKSPSLILNHTFLQNFEFKDKSNSDDW